MYFAYLRLLRFWNSHLKGLRVRGLITIRPSTYTRLASLNTIGTFGRHLVGLARCPKDTFFLLLPTKIAGSKGWPTLLGDLFHPFNSKGSSIRRHDDGIDGWFSWNLLWYVDVDAGVWVKELRLSSFLGGDDSAYKQDAKSTPRYAASFISMLDKHPST